MAIGTGCFFECRSTATASNVNGGGFNPQNTSMATDGAATSATGNSPVFTSASYNFVAGDVGHWVYIKSGTNWTPGWYQIASVAANAATLTASIGTAVQPTSTFDRMNIGTVAGCATTASPTGATWSVDYSQSDAAPFTATDLTGTTTDCTSATNPFGKNMVANIIQFNTTGTGGTTGYYEIKSVSTITATLDRSAGATYSGVTYHTGGAFSLGSSDDAVFELGSTLNGAQYFVKGGTGPITYTIGGTVAISLGGSASMPTIIQGYASVRGDNPTGTTRPIFALGTVAFTLGNNIHIKYINSTGTGASNFALAGTYNQIHNSLSINSSTTANRTAINSTANTGGGIFNCEAISYRGNGIAITAAIVNACFAHDSKIGILGNANVLNGTISNCISSSNVTAAISLQNSLLANITNNTLYGSENKQGIGISEAGASGIIYAMNNIIYGFTTGSSLASPSTSLSDDYNNYFNNTTDINLNWSKGVHDIALNPSFTNVVQRTGSTATTTAGDHLVQSGATFQTWGITAGTDHIYVKSGTGVAAGVYGIASVDSETQLTLTPTIAANATGDKTWQITQFNNFAVGTNMKAAGYPGVFPGGLTTGYLDIGAVQRQETSGGSGGSFTFS